MNENLSFLKNKALSLPSSPGVYIMKNKTSKIIYIGKAKILPNRVGQYFMSQNRHPEKVRQMVENVYDFDYIITDSEFEALILECNLIKKHCPKYNILLKDDKGYNYIKLSNSPWPKITAEKQKLDDNAKYWGPYNSAFVVKQSVDRVNKIFSLPTCNKTFKEGKSTCKPCLNFYIKQCLAPCTGKISKEQYDNCIKEALAYLNGNTNLNIKEMQAQMLKYSENLEFEKAAKIRDRINAVKHLTKKQSFVNLKIKQLDVIAFKASEKEICFEIFRFDDYTLYDKEEYIIKSFEENEKIRSDFILQYYSAKNDIPPVILTDGELENKDLILRWLSDKRGKNVKIVIPQKGELSKLVKLCQKNATEHLAQRENRTWKESTALEQIKDMLQLKSLPTLIEAYDISNLGGTENVAGMVVFKNGKPFKKAYRRFQIKTVVGQDDYGSMSEVLTRRFNEYLAHKDDDNTFGILPDLILLDGGKGHVATVQKVFNEFGLNIPLFGMVKDNKHKTRAIASNGYEVGITDKREAFTLISTIQEEVHRFAIGYHRKKRSNTISSQLLSIEGIGEKKARLLLTKLRTINNIKNASVTDLMQIKGISEKNAKAIYEYFNNQ